MKDIEKERERERERAWNKPLSARSRTLSHSGSAGHSPSPRRGSDQPRSTSNSAPRSREDSRAPSPSESVRSRATEEGEENYERERSWGSSRPKWDHQYRPPASPIPGSSVLRPRTQSTHSNGSDRRLRHTPSQSSLHSEGSSRPSSPTDLTHRRKDEDEESIHERERNWGSRQQKWTHTYIRKQAASPNPTTSLSRVQTNSEPDPSAPAGSALTRPPNGPLKGRPAEQHLSSPHSAPPPDAPEQAERDETSRYPTSTSPQPKPTNGYPHDKPLRMPSRHPRPDSPLPSTVNGNSADVKSASPGSATRFGWQFPRNRPQLPDFEPDTSSPERSSSPVHRPTSRIVGSGIPSHIPVRSPGQVPKVVIKRSGDGQTFTKGHKRATTEFSEANGAVPPKIHLPEREFASESESTDAPSLRGLLPPRFLSRESFSCFIFPGSDDSIQDAPTPIARPIEIPPPEKLRSFSPIRTASAAEDPDSDASSPPAVTPIDAAPSFELSTPPRPSLSTSKIEFETPPPPKGLPELPGPPSSSDDETESIDIASSNRQNDVPVSLNVTKTPRVPGAWAATPAPARSQTPQPTSSSFAPARLSRARSNSLPQTSFTEIQSSTVAPPSALSRAGTLPIRTPAPPGGWFSTPGSLRRKSLLKVRFDNLTSDSAISDSDMGAKDGKVEVLLPVADWDAGSSSRPAVNASDSISEPSFNHVESSSPAPGSSTQASRDVQEVDGPTANSPTETTNYTTAASSLRRKSRRSPSVRLVDEYGRAQEDPPITPSRKDVRDHSASLRMPGGGPLKTPRTTSVRIVDEMGHEVEEPSEQNDSEDTVTEVRYSRQEALQRMKRAVADLQDGLRGVDT
jgi:serine/arginine repetitive matrix protein 2